MCSHSQICIWRKIYTNIYLLYLCTSFSIKAAAQWFWSNALNFHLAQLLLLCWLTSYWHNLISISLFHVRYVDENAISTVVRCHRQYWLIAQPCGGNSGFNAQLISRWLKKVLNKSFYSPKVTKHRFDYIQFRFMWLAWMHKRNPWNQPGWISKQPERKSLEDRQRYQIIFYWLSVTITLK